MLVKDLIKELQALDPEAIVDMPLAGIMQLPGYYDGPSMRYEDGKLIINKTKNKVRFYQTEFWDILEDCDGDEVKFRKSIVLEEGEERYHKHNLEWLEFKIQQTLEEWVEVSKECRFYFKQLKLFRDYNG